MKKEFSLITYSETNWLKIENCESTIYSPTALFTEGIELILASSSCLSKPINHNNANSKNEMFQSIYYIRIVH